MAVQKLFTCRVCGAANTQHAWRCEEHYRCDDCLTRKGICTYTEGVLCEACHIERVNARIAKFKGKTQFTDEVVCPHCGYKHSDSWEWNEGEHECCDCGRKFEMTRYTEVTYCTAKVGV